MLICYIRATVELVVGCCRGVFEFQSCSFLCRPRRRSMLRIDARVFGLMHKLIDRCLALSQITVSSILMIPLHCTIYVFYWINAFLGVLRMAVLLFDVEWSYCNHRHRRQRKKKYQSLLSVHGSRHGGVHFPLLSPASLHQRLPFPNQPEPVQLLLTL